MGTITLSIPEELKAKMDKVDVINWSSVARHAFIEQLKDIKRLQQLKEFKKIISKSKSTKEDAEFFSEKVKKTMHDDLVKKDII